MTRAALAVYLSVGVDAAAPCPDELHVSGPAEFGVSGTYTLNGTSSNHPRYVQVSWPDGPFTNATGLGRPHYIRYWWKKHGAHMWGLSKQAEGRHFEVLGPNADCPNMSVWSDPKFDGGLNLTVRAQHSSASVPSANGRCTTSPMNSGFFGYCNGCGSITTEAECWSSRSAFNCCQWIPSGASCDFPNSNNVTGPGCACAHGYSGAVHIGINGHYANCIRVPCVNMSGADPRDHTWLKESSASYPYCECADGYAGKTWWGQDGFGWTVLGEGWDGPEKYGGSDGSLWWKCRQAPCNIENSNQINGTGCACAKGYSGNITWVGIENECDCAGEGPSCNCDGSWKGVCTPTHATFNETGVAGKFLSTTGKSSQGQGFSFQSAVAFFSIIAFLLFCASRISMRMRFPAGVQAPFMSSEDE